MQTLLRSVHLLALIVWIGEIVFFSFVGAPAIFRTLGPEAGKVVGVIFPVYYIIGYVCGVILLVTSVLLLRQASAHIAWATTSVLAAMMLAVTLYAGLSIQPRAAALRPLIHDPATMATAKPDFDRLHSSAVVLNSVVLVCGLVVSVLTARSLRP